MRVFKYRTGDEATFNRDLHSLQNDFFWASTRDLLNDPFEGVFEMNQLDTQLEWLNKLVADHTPSTKESFNTVKKSITEVLSFVDKSGIFSLSKSPTEELLWAHYGWSHNGFCIEYDLEKLIEFDKNNHHCIEIKYSKVAPILKINDLIREKDPTKILQKMLGVKSIPWKYESEVRVVTTASGKQPYDYRAVKAIYFGARMQNKEKRDDIMKALAGRGIKYFQIETEGLSYKLTARPLTDLFAAAPRYKYSIAPIANGAITSDYLKPELQKYGDYLYKAAEIVRREPYCNQINYVDFSSTKSSKKSPVIFVQYQRADNQHIIHYLSISEIEAQYALITDLE